MTDKPKPLVVVIDTGYEGRSRVPGAYTSFTSHTENEKAAKKRPELAKGNKVSFWEAAGFKLNSNEKGRLKKYSKTIPIKNPSELHVGGVGKLVTNAMKKGFNILHVNSAFDPYTSLGKKPSEVIVLGHWRQACLKDVILSAQKKWPGMKCKMVIGTGSVKDWISVPKKNKAAYEKLLKEGKIEKITVNQFNKLPSSGSEFSFFTSSLLDSRKLTTELGRKSLKDISKFAKRKFKAKYRKK